MFSGVAPKSDGPSDATGDRLDPKGQISRESGAVSATQGRTSGTVLILTVRQITMSPQLLTP